MQSTCRLLVNKPRSAHHTCADVLSPQQQRHTLHRSMHPSRFQGPRLVPIHPFIHATCLARCSWVLGGDDSPPEPILDARPETEGVPLSLEVLRAKWDATQAGGAVYALSARMGGAAGPVKLIIR